MYLRRGSTHQAEDDHSNVNLIEMPHLLVLYCYDFIIAAVIIIVNAIHIGHLFNISLNALLMNTCL